MKRWRFVLFAWLLVAPNIAHAEPKDDARRHFISGLTAAKEQRYEDALEHFLDAQRAYPHPNTLFNIARAYQDLNDLEQAIEYYTLFQRAKPDKASVADPILAVLRARLDSQPRPESGTATTTGSSTVAQSELDRLKALAKELQDAIDGLQIKPETTTSTSGTTEQPTDTTEIPETAFQANAYERIVVTASRYGQDPLDSPSTVTVLSADTIRQSGATNIPDLLRRVVGVDVMSMAASQPDLSIRGFNRELSNKVLILVDGRSVYWDFIGTTFWSTLPVAMAEIERIEVIRGPGSAVYGANAMTGVVNIITKTPGSEPGTYLQIAAGYPDLMNGTLVTSGRVKDTSFRLSGQFSTHGRWTQAESLQEDSGTKMNLPDPNRAQQVASFTGRFDRSIGDKAFASLSGGYSQGYAEFYNIGALGNSLARNRHHFVRADAGYGPLLFRAFWNRDMGTYRPVTESIGSSRSVSSPFTADTVDVELSGNGEFKTGPISHRLSGGVGYRRKSIADFNLLSGDIVEDHANIYFNEEASLGKFTSVFSLRLDRHPLIPLSQTLSPRGALIARLADKTSLRLTAGTAFRAPNMVESYMDFALSSGTDGVYIQDYGSQNLVPERIITAELGLHDESSVYHMANVVLYYNRVTDFIGLAPVTPGTAPYDAVENGFLAGTTGWINLDPAYNGFGVEAEAEVFPLDGLDLFANVNVAAILEANAAGTLRDGSTSLVKANLGGSYRSPFRTDFSLAMHFVSAQTWRLRSFDAAGQIVETPSDIPARFLLSARIASRPFANEDLELSWVLFNGLGLSNSLRFREHPSGQLVGPRLFGTLSYRF